jgi:hypothetical protein
VSIQQSAAEEGQAFQGPCKALIKLLAFLLSFFLDVPGIYL